MQLLFKVSDFDLEKFAVIPSVVVESVWNVLVQRRSSVVLVVGRHEVLLGDSLRICYRVCCTVHTKGWLHVSFRASNRWLRCFAVHCRVEVWLIVSVRYRVRLLDVVGYIGTPIELIGALLLLRAVITLLVRSTLRIHAFLWHTLSMAQERSSPWAVIRLVLLAATG